MRAARSAVLIVLALLLVRAAPAAASPTTSALRGLYDSGQLDRATYEARRADYLGFRRAVSRFSGRRRADMAGVLHVVDGISARGRLTASRLEQLWLTMRRNREWWDNGPLLYGGQRVSFPGSELVWQYVPGEGLQFHPLANFGVLDGLTAHKSDRARLAAMLDELLPLAVRRAGGVAWEYDFDFDGGRPPWVSGLAEGTAVQALAKAAVALGRQADVLPVARQALGVFRTPPPSGVRVRADGGVHYLQYSFAPGVRVLNGFIQSLTGLWDYVTFAQDPSAQPLFDDGLRAARAEIPRYDTGAWSLYELGGSDAESDLHYHVLLRDFLRDLCKRTSDDVVCGTAERFTADLTEPPALALVTRRLRRGRPGALRFKLSKVSTVTVRMTRGATTVLARTAALPYGTHTEDLLVPRRRGRYAVSIDATDLAGNHAQLQGTVAVR